MMKWIAQVVVLLGLTGAAVAQPAAAGSASAEPAAAPTAAAPTAAVPTAAAPTAAAPTAAAPTAAVPTAAAPTDPSPMGNVRKACAAAMNADPEFAKEIVKVADERAQVQRDNDTIKAHEDADAHVKKNERHVIYAYAALWIVAALFVIFLWRRQQGLQAEIASLRRDLDAAAADEAKRPA